MDILTLDEREKWVRQFYKLYFKREISPKELEQCLKYKYKYMPDSLFKYTKINHVSDYLSDNLMFISKINDLNDPYEGDILYDLERLYELYVNYYFGIILDIDYFDGEIDESDLQWYLSNISKEEVKNNFDEVIEKFNDTVSVVCLSECNTINPMWSHYSNDHKGVCIEYDFIPDSNIKQLCFPMDYVRVTNNEQVLEEILKKGVASHRLLSEIYLKKSHDWDYEREWRVVLFDDDSQNLLNISTDGYFKYIPFLKPKAVYLGLKIDEDDERDVIDLCKFNNIPVYRMVKDNSNYNMAYEEVKWK